MRFQCSFKNLQGLQPVGEPGGLHLLCGFLAELGENGMDGLAYHRKDRGDHSSVAYSMLGAYLTNMIAFKEGEGLTVKDYIDAIAKNDLGKLVNGWIRPAEEIRVNEDNLTISESLIFA